MRGFLTGKQENLEQENVKVGARRGLDFRQLPLSLQACHHVKTRPHPVRVSRVFGF
jgi:hypothetical protein